MSERPSLLRPAVARCLTLAGQAATGGDGERARGLLALALDLAAPHEVAVVLTASDRLLAGSGVPVRRPAAPAPAPPPVAPPPASPFSESPEPAAPRAPRPAPAPPKRSRTRIALLPLLVAALLGALVWGGIQALRERPEPRPGGAVSLLHDADPRAGGPGCAAACAPPA